MIEFTGKVHQGKKLFRKETLIRTCRDCIYADPREKGVHCWKHHEIKCMENGKEYIFIVET